MLKKILGTQPALVLTAIQVAITVLVTIPEVGLSQHAASVVITLVLAVGALLEGWTAVETRLSLVVGLTKALFAALVLFGLDLTEETLTAIVAGITILFGAYTQGKTRSATTALSFSDPDAAAAAVQERQQKEKAAFDAEYQKAIDEGLTGGALEVRALEISRGISARRKM